MAVPGALKLSFAASAVLAPCTAQCLRLRNPIAGVFGDVDVTDGGTTYVLNQDSGALSKVRSAISSPPALVDLL